MLLLGAAIPDPTSNYERSHNYPPLLKVKIGKFRPNVHQVQLSTMDDDIADEQAVEAYLCEFTEWDNS